MSNGEGDFDRQYEPPEKETVTNEAYEQALGNLRRFAVDGIEETPNLGELTLKLQTVGRDLWTVICKKGKSVDQITPDERQELPLFSLAPVTDSYFLHGSVENATIIAQNIKNKISISGDIGAGQTPSDSNSPFKYDVEVPFDEKINLYLHPRDVLSKVRATEWRTERGARDYNPATPQEQQGYARLLQEGVREILAVADPAHRIEYPPALQSSDYQPVSEPEREAETPEQPNLMDEESLSERIQRHQAANRRQQAEWMQDARKGSIDQYIEYLQREVEQPDPDKQRRKQYHEREIGIFEYLRDRFHAQTIGDAEEQLRQGDVPSNVVRLWLEERLVDSPSAPNPIFGNTFLRNAVLEGYPELDYEFKRQDKEWEDYLDSI